MVNGVGKRVLWLDLGLLYSCNSFCYTLIFPESISKTQLIYFFTSLNVEVSRHQLLSIFSDVISDKMSLIVVLSYSSFLPFFPLSEWNMQTFRDTAVQHNYILFSFLQAEFEVSFETFLSLSSRMGRVISSRRVSQKFEIHDSNTLRYD